MAECYLCQHAITPLEEAAEYDTGWAIEPIHLACGEADNEARGERAAFAGMER